MFFTTHQWQTMSNDPDDTLPSGVTLIDTDSDIDAFSLALYSRIHQHTDIVDPVEEDDLSGPPNSPTVNHTDTHPDHNTTTNEMPTTFVSRIRQQLQNICRTPPSPPPHSSPKSSTTATSFLDIAEQQLQEYYDRVLSGDELLDKDGDAFAELNAEQLEEACLRRFGQSLNDITLPVREIVHSTIDDYKNYFEAEKDILEAATRYDSLQTWLRHTRDLFETTSLSPTAEQTNELEAKLHDYMTNTPEWKTKFIDAKHKWNQLCTSRQAVCSIHQLVGGTTGCRICFNKQVKTLLVPCGHVLCEECANRVSSCPFCNTSFYARQDVYFM